MKRLVLSLVVLLLAFGFVPQSHSQDTVDITFVHIFGDENDVRGAVVKGLVDQFMEQNPDINVTMQTTISDYGEVLDQTVLAADQGDAPHVVQLDETAAIFAVDSDYFLKLEDRLSDEQMEDIMTDVLPAVLGFNIIDDALWSLPWNSSNPIMYVNRTMFSDAGLDPDDPPQTFDEILAACEVLMSSDLNLTGCINWPLTSWFVEVWLAQQGALFVDQENGHVGRPEESFLNSPEVLGIFEWWDEMADKGYYGYTGKTTDYNGEAGAFITRKFAMHLNSCAGLSNFQYYADLMGYDLGVVPFPRPTEEESQGTINGGSSLWITAGHADAEIDASVKLILFLTNAENIAQWHQETGYFPNRLSAIDIVESTGFWETNPQYAVAVEQLLQTVPSPATAGAVFGAHGAVREIVNAAVQSMIDQDESPEDVLAAAKQLADAEIEDYNFFYAD